MSISAALLCLVLIGSALAAGRIDVGRACSLTIEYRNDADEAIAGAEFRLYRVGSISGDAEFAPTDSFRRYADFLDGGLNGDDWQALADALPGYVAMDGRIQPYRSLSGADCVDAVDGSGLLNFEGLETGLYLVVGQTAELKDTRYDVRASLVSLPCRDGSGQWDYAPTILPKENPLPGEPVSLLVQKNWSGDTEAARPAEITVQLLGDGELVEEVRLNRGNNWQHQWENLKGGVSWRVIENPVPDGYRPSYSGEGGLTVITNTRPGTPTGNTKLPQTGMLWWPVPALALAGMALFTMGWTRARRNEN